MKKNIFLIKKNNYLLIIFFITTTICSCIEKGVSIDLPYDGDKIVLNSFIMKDSLIYARVTASEAYNNFSPDFQFTVPVGARVKLYENDIFKEEMEMRTISEKVYFISSFRAQVGKKYTLKASANNMEDVEGSDKVPSKPLLQGINFTYGGDKYRAKIRIIDNGNEVNYYRLRVIGILKNDMNLISDNNYPVPFAINNLDLNGSGIFGKTPETENYFSDELMNGKDITLSLSLEASNMEYSHIIVKLDNLTHATYNYLLSVYKQNVNGISPVSEPTIVYNNIENGYGIVGALAENAVIIEKQ